MHMIIKNDISLLDLEYLLRADGYGSDDIVLLLKPYATPWGIDDSKITRMVSVKALLENEQICFRTDKKLFTRVLDEFNELVTRLYV